MNPPTTSNFGGAWESMIRLVRKALTHSIHRHVLTDESLRTIFCEAEYIVNSGPLTASPDDPTPLTPNQLLTLKVSESRIVQFDERDQFSTKRWKLVQVIAQNFRKRWKQEYLNELQIRQKWCHTAQNLAPGDIVLIEDPAAPRTHLPVATVAEVRRSSDGLVRSATVKNAYSTLVRPVNKLVKLFTPK